MRVRNGSVLRGLLAAQGLVGIWSLGVEAQEIDATACEQACYEQKSECVSVCGEHGNPVECEEACDDELEDCLRQCR